MKQVIAVDPTFGLAPSLASALGAYEVYRQPDIKNIKGDFDYGYHRIIPDMPAIVVGSNCLNDVYFTLEGPITVILTDSFYLKHTAHINKIIRENNVEVYAMTDLAHLVEVDWKPYYAPFKLPDIDTTKVEGTVCHSPFSDKKQLVKGSSLIRSTVEELGMEFVEILMLPWEECLKEKAKHKVFVDQVVDRENYKGGLGKSGIEAMLLGACVVSSGEHVENPYIPSPPVVWTSRETLKEDLQHAIKYSDFYTKQQQKWVDKYTSYQFIREYFS